MEDPFNAHQELIHIIKIEIKGRPILIIIYRGSAIIPLNPGINMIALHQG